MGIIIFVLFIYAIYKLQHLDVQKIPCHKLKKGHSWTYRGEDGNEYMVCKECGMMPGGQFEEG